MRAYFCLIDKLYYLHCMKWTLLLILFFPICTFAQSINVLNKSGIKLQKEKNNFRYVNKKLDTVNLQYVATIKVSAIKNTLSIEDLFMELKQKANEMGANCFKLREYNNGSGSINYCLILDVYFAAEDVLKQNSKLHAKNVVFVLPDFNTNAHFKSQELLVNNNKVIIEKHSYLKYELSEGDSLKLQKIGIAKGTPNIIIGSPNEVATFCVAFTFDNATREGRRQSSSDCRGLGYYSSHNVRCVQFIARIRDLFDRG